MTLAAFDRVFAGHAVAIALAYPGRLDEERLAAALERASAIAPGLDARLTAVAVTHLPEDVTDPRALADIVPALAERTIEARLTRGPAGCVLGVTMSHASADGFSFFSFLRAWSRAAAGHAVPSPPSDRALFTAVGAPVSLTPEEVWRSTGFTWTPGRVRERPPAGFGACLTLPEIEAVDGLSPHDLVCAGLVCRFGAELAGTAGLALTMPVDCRRLLPGVPNNYFGNVVRCAPLRLTPDVLAAEGLHAIARRVQAAVQRANNEPGAREALSCLQALPAAAFDELHLVDPEAGFLITNVSRLPFGMLDLGAGLPTRAFLPAMDPRIAVIQQHDDGIDVSFRGPSGLH